MTRKDFLKYHDEFLTKMRKVVAQKNADYCGDSHDFAFTNFCQIEVDGLASTEIGLWTRFRDKTARLLTFIKTGILQVKDEKVTDTILDACNYLIILAAYLEYKRSLTDFKTEFLSKNEEAMKCSDMIREFNDRQTLPIEEDPFHCDKRTEHVDAGALGPLTVHYGEF